MRGRASSGADNLHRKPDAKSCVARENFAQIRFETPGLAYVGPLKHLPQVLDDGCGTGPWFA